ncbi:hypothetical protein PUNSTDRAFT_72931 [Punctularia strigosozonata HHB-11173 SS5]|uniref:uncharacterized protein n=1 Tax=Punctularia strigosozonata (strain HHB-11173) TaxID=741275 RepID=UPI0004416512|nr:uncharacterized protein PUNSTDRAFT_72931 [Punctularia strigosozonata HHB-11173 SS5]EIN06243.1 hypothetical protein PUNSTDRAFT_72931 [Punctularia strigosozonata HHB-11173 SS5]
MPNAKAGDLYSGEIFWRDHYEWLNNLGYKLRDRYRPGWVPSWRDKSNVTWYEQEDSYPFLDTRVADATRVADGTTVALKLIYPDDNPQVEDVIIKLGSEPLASDARNHCVPIYEILPLPDGNTARIIVMPLLRKYDNPRWDTIGEVVSCIQQIFEASYQGLQLMHAYRIAHRDCTGNNIMLDPRNMYPKSFHPAEPNRSRDWRGNALSYTRTQRPSSYYLIDFGLSQLYPPHGAKAIPVEGGDKSVPEFQSNPNGEYDPFPVDVYYLGNWVKQYIIKVKAALCSALKLHGFEFLEPLMDEMTSRDPIERPNMNQVMTRLAEIVESTGSWKLRSRVVAYKEHPIIGLYRAVGHWKRRIIFIVTRTPPIPVPTRGPPVYTERKPLPATASGVSTSTEPGSVARNSGAAADTSSTP